MPRSVSSNRNNPKTLSSNNRLNAHPSLHHHNEPLFHLHSFPKTTFVIFILNLFQSNPIHHQNPKPNTTPQNPSHYRNNHKLTPTSSPKQSSTPPQRTRTTQNQKTNITEQKNTFKNLNPKTTTTKQKTHPQQSSTNPKRIPRSQLMSPPCASKKHRRRVDGASLDGSEASVGVPIGVF